MASSITLRKIVIWIVASVVVGLGLRQLALQRAAQVTQRAEERAEQAEQAAVEPTVTRAADGDFIVRLPPGVQSSLDKFLAHNTSLKVASIDDLKLRGQKDRYIREDLEPFVKSGDMQAPYACWGDFNKDGHLDVAIVLVTKKPFNAWGWHEWWIVVFHGSTSGQFKTLLVTKEVGGAMDVLLYHRRENIVEFAILGVAAGTFQWNGRGYTVRHMIGH